jgi:hypothetical protein
MKEVCWKLGGRPRETPATLPAPRPGCAGGRRAPALQALRFAPYFRLTPSFSTVSVVISPVGSRSASCWNA